MYFVLNKLKSQLKQSWLVDILAILIVFALFYAIGIGSHALFTPDEGRYSEVAREMVASGDYITPRLNGVAFLDKPALYYWLQASAIHLFGLKDWALRFWPATLGIFGALVTYIVGRRLYNRRAGILAAIMLATSPLYYGAAHYANLDLEVAVLISTSLLCFIAAMQSVTSLSKNGFLYTAYFFAGLAVLTKGLIGIAFPALIIGAWIAMTGRWRTLLHMRVLSGLCLFALIVVPWYYLVQQANPEFLHFFFVTQQVSRFLTTQDFNDKAPVWFYVPVVLLGLMPWSIFLFQALSKKIRAIWQAKSQHAVDLYLLIWFFVVFVFFSIPRSKTVGYILPLFPVGALLIGSYLSQIWDKAEAKKAGWVFIIMSSVIAGGLFITPMFAVKLEIPRALLPFLQGMGGCFLLAAVLSLFCFRQKNVLPFFSVMVVTISAALLIFMTSAGVINEKSTKPLALMLKPMLAPTDEVVVYYKYYQDLPIYLERRVTVVADWHSPDIQKRDNWLREMWYGMVFQDTKDWLIEDDTFWQRWHSNKRLYVITDQGYYEHLSQKARVYKLAQFHDAFLLSNQSSFIERPNTY